MAVDRYRKTYVRNNYTPFFNNILVNSIMLKIYLYIFIRTSQNVSASYVLATTHDFRSLKRIFGKLRFGLYHYSQ